MYVVINFNIFFKKSFQRVLFTKNENEAVDSRANVTHAHESVFSGSFLTEETKKIRYLKSFWHVVKSLVLLFKSTSYFTWKF